MAGEMPDRPTDGLRGMSVPVAVAVSGLVVLAWFVTWATSGLTMGLLGMGSRAGIGPMEAAMFFAIIVVMMVAMMLPSALPMIVAFHGMTRLEAGRPARPADAIATALFVAPYFLVWGAFGVLALVGLMAIGLAGPLTGVLVLVPAATLVAAGVYQLTRPKEACLTQCQSPMGFVMAHWRAGRSGAVRMGLRHSVYCLGCCWLFMLVLFISGSMSLLWMGGISVVIFVEKLGIRPLLFARAIGVLLVALGALAGIGAFIAV